MLDTIISELTLQANNEKLPYKSKHIAAVLNKRGLCRYIRF